MSDFIHCNKCHSRFQKNIKFYLISCGHLNCEICVNAIKDTKKCNVCNKPCNVMLLTNDLDYNIQQFFVPFENTLKKNVEIYEFQLQHRSRMFELLTNKYTYAKKECMNYVNENKKLKKENQWLKNLLKNTGMGKPPNFLTSTPLNRDGSIADTNDNTVSSIRGNLDFMTPVSSRNATQQSYNLQSRYAPRLPGHAERLFDYNKMQRPSPSQIVPRGFGANAPVHRNYGMGSMNSLEELRKAGKL